MIKSRNKIESRKILKKINEIKNWFFEKINQIDKPLAKLTHFRKWRYKLPRWGMKRYITIGPVDIKGWQKKYYKQLYAHEFDNLDEMGQFL